MRSVLELLRIIIIILLLGGLGWKFMRNIYTINEATETYSWLGAIAVVLLLFVLYRNKLQFSGWYDNEHQEAAGNNRWPLALSGNMVEQRVIAFSFLRYTDGYLNQVVKFRNKKENLS